MRIGKWPIFLLYAATSCGAALAQSSGMVRGSVLDENGRVVEGASVECDPLDSRPSANALLIVETDKNGRFSVGNLGLGSYKLFAMKESSGYPNTAFGFYSNNVFPTVTLTTAVPGADITLRVGPSAGVLSGSVSDAVTGAPLPNSFLLRRSSDPENWISMSQKADYRVLVPPSVEVSIEVSAPGYKTWYYGGPFDRLKRDPIRLESGKEMRLDIQLQPEEKPQKQP
jgi:hypothetical protein